MLTRRQACLAISLLIASCFLPLGESLHSGFWSSLSDGIHVPLFFTLTLLADITLQKQVPSLPWRLAILFCTAFICGSAIEVIQPYFGRSESLVDLENGTIGNILGLAYLAVTELPIPNGPAESTIRRRRWLEFILASAACLGVVFIPATEYYRLEKLQEQRFPVLSQLGSGLERLAWEPYGGAKLHFLKSGLGVELRLGNARYSGTEFVPPNLDWNGYRALRIKLYFPDRTGSIGQGLWIRIDDNGKCEERDDRFEREFSVPFQSAVLELPLSEIENSPAQRKLNLDSIKRILLFSDRSKGTTADRLVIQRMELVK